MQSGDCVGQTEPEPASAHGPAFLGLVEPLQHALAILDGYATAPIGDPHERLLVLVQPRQRDDRTHRCIFERVIEQIADGF